MISHYQLTYGDFQPTALQIRTKLTATWNTSTPFYTYTELLWQTTTCFHFNIATIALSSQPEVGMAYEALIRLDTNHTSDVIRRCVFLLYARRLLVSKPLKTMASFGRKGVAATAT